MRGVHSILILCLAALSGAGLSGCGLFQPTEPEPPSGGVVDADYTQPERTETTLDLAVEDKGRTTGQTAYLDGLAEASRDGVGFTMIPLASVVQRLENAGVNVQPWTHSRESDFYLKLIAIDGTDYSMEWLPDPRFDGEDRTDDVEAIRNRIYTIQAESGLIAKGYARLTFRQTAPGRWVVVTWEERSVEPGDSEDITFSMLRLNP